MMGGVTYMMTLALEALAFAVFAVLVVAVPYARRKRDYWTGRGVTAATGTRALAATVPGVRLDDGTLALYRQQAAATRTAVLGLHDAGRPCALACDVRVAADALGNDGFAEPHGHGGDSLIPRTVDADVVAAVLPAMNESTCELITSLEAVANLRRTIVPWTYAKKCSATAVATCVYGQPMVDSRINAFAEQCDRALSRPAITDYFAAYDLSSTISYGSASSSTDFKRLLMATAADQYDSSDVADKQVRLDMFEFVTGAIESTAALVTAALYELSRDETIQNKLREHLDSVLDKHQQKITQDQLDRLSYLDDVLKETLRKYPLIAVVHRVTTKPYVVPDGGRATLEPGTLIAVPVHAFHHDGANFVEPETFQPNRFPEQLSAAYMPYGSGLQSYILKHFVVVEAKLILAMLVFRYAVHVDNDDPGRSPNPFDRTSYAGVRVKLMNRKGVQEPILYTSLRKCKSDEKKFLLFR